MRLQKDIFLESEGNAWLERNRDKLGEHDPVSEIIEQMGLRPASVLEVGCANGWRLKKLRDKYGCEIWGIEPSARACIEAAELKVPVTHGTASIMPFSPQTFDLIIYGFCLYLTDPSNWFRIAAEGDSALKDGGHIIIHDFAARTQEEFARRYQHRDGVLAYHVPFQNFWLAHPLYRTIRYEFCDPDTGVIAIKKEPSDFIEVRP